MLTFDLDLALREATALHASNQIFILMDENTEKHCYAEVEKTLEIPRSHRKILPAGEVNKSLDTVTQIWDWFICEHANRQSILLILGGGVLCDMGGFAAATFMRGMPFVNIPTTLLAAVDAGDGGKTGFNYKGLKNYIGLFAQPKVSIVYPPFLETLPAREIRSGYAEMLKHAVIASPLELAQILAFSPNEIGKIDEESTFAELLRRSIEIKNYIVEQDPEEHHIRKTLNFGHTVGHALEEYFLEHTPEQALLHGEAVAQGLIAELYLSYMKLGFNKEILRQIVHFIRENYGKIACPCKDYDTLIALMKQDKKGNPQQGVEGINCTLLPVVGNYRINQLVTDAEMAEALDFLFNQ